MIYLDDFIFPSMPENITLGIEGNMLTYKLIDGNSVSIPRGTDTKTIKWSGVFFGKARKNTGLIKRYTNPKECVRILEDALTDGSVMNLIVDEAPINEDVIISTFSWVPTGAFGDIEYSIELTKAGSLRIYTTSELNINPYTLPREPSISDQQSSAQTGTQYTVKSGDTLWKISSMYLGGGANWQKLYNANSGVIESTAKQHGKSNSDNGHWIYPGCVLTIPA